MSKLTYPVTLTEARKIIEEHLKQYPNEYTGVSPRRFRALAEKMNLGRLADNGSKPVRLLTAHDVAALQDRIILAAQRGPGRPKQEK